MNVLMTIPSRNHMNETPKLWMMHVLRMFGLDYYCNNEIYSENLSLKSKPCWLKVKKETFNCPNFCVFALSAKWSSHDSPPLKWYFVVFSTMQCCWLSSLYLQVFKFFIWFNYLLGAWEQVGKLGVGKSFPDLVLRVKICCWYGRESKSDKPYWLSIHNLTQTCQSLEGVGSNPWASATQVLLLFRLFNIHFCLFLTER